MYGSNRLENIGYKLKNINIVFNNYCYNEYLSRDRLENNYLKWLNRGLLQYYRL